MADAPQFSVTEMKSYSPRVSVQTVNLPHNLSPDRALMCEVEVVCLGSRSGGEDDPTAAQLAPSSSISRGRGNAAEVRGQGKRAMSVVVLLGLLLLGGAAVVLIKRRNRAF